MKKIVFILFMFFYFDSFCQHEKDNWFFGDSAAITFLNGPPVNLPNSPLKTSEGSSTISSASGQLLFYSDGITVWNANHQVMPNGTGLYGGFSSSQSCLIVPDPDSSEVYYIFTASEQGGGHGLNYSKVDMTLQSGLGDLTQKNVNLVAGLFDEKLTAFAMRDSTYWLITHALSRTSKKYYAFRIRKTGIDAPVISNVSIHYNISNFDAIGCMKISPTGQYIANAQSGTDRVEIASFDTVTGTVSNPFIYQSFSLTQLGGMYAVEFSPSGQRLYLGFSEFTSKIFQLDMSLSTPAAIISSATTIATVPSSFGAGTLQLAPDGKIYWAIPVSYDLCVIDFPDSIGSACHYGTFAYTLNFRSQSIYGLPNFVVGSIIHPVPKPQAQFSISNTLLCAGECISLTNTSINGQSYQWYFPGSTQPSMTSSNPNDICYLNPGLYDVTLIATNTSGSDTITLTNLIQVRQPLSPMIFVHGDTLAVSPIYSTYQWFGLGNQIPGAIHSDYKAPFNGSYYVIVSDTTGCTVSSDTISFIVDGIDETRITDLMNYNIGSDEINFKHPSEIKIFDMQGRLLFNDNHCSSINISRYLDGIYFIFFVRENRYVKLLKY